MLHNTPNNDNHTTQPTTGRTFVIGAQFDDTGLEALSTAWLLATPEDRLHLCYCAGPEQAIPVVDDVMLTAGTKRLQDWAARNLLGTPAIARTQLHTRLGQPADALIQLAAEVDADLIVVGTHDKGMLARLVDGSTMQQLVENAPCPVLVARPKDFDNIDTLPSVEPAPTSRQVTRTLQGTRAYSYQRSIPLAVPQPSVGPTV